MAVLQGTWWRSRFHLWGDRATASVPEVLQHDELHAMLGELSRDTLLTLTAEESSIRLWRPSGESETHAATAVPEGQTDRRSAFRTVMIPTLAFPAADAVDLLVDLSASRPPNHSDSLRFWAQLARLVLLLLARQQFAPDLEGGNEGTLQARWRLFLCDRDRLSRLERYAAAMPPVCRAAVSADPEQSRPTRLVDSFLTLTADAVIRRDLSHDPFFRQIHDRAARESRWELRWLSGLIGESRTVDGLQDDDESIASQIRAWIGRLNEEIVGPLPKLRFRLIEPADDQTTTAAKWHVGIELCCEESGEVSDIRTIWSEPPDAGTILGLLLVSRRAHVQAELARASEVFVELKRAARTGAPTDVALTTGEAHTFLRHRAPLLMAQGFEVALPEWAERTDRRLGVQLFVEPSEFAPDAADAPSIGTFGLSALLDFDWRVAVGDEKLSLDEFERLTAQNVPLIKHHGDWVDIDQEAAERALTFLRTQPRGKITLATAIRLASGAEELDTGLPILGLSGADWIERLLRDVQTVEFEQIDQPTDFVGTLRPYQRRGLAWLAFLDRVGIGACLADDMGLGKTIELIALLLHERREGRKPGPTLLFAPMSVVGNWEREVQRFAPSLRTLVHHGPDRLSGDAFVQAASRHDIVLTSYGLAQRDLQDLQGVDWYRLTLDEAQKIKNPSANQTLAIRSLPGAHRVALTGTPIENHLSELWSIMEMLNPGLLGTAAAFRTRFAIPIEKSGDHDRAEQLRRMIRPFLLRRLKSDPDVECDLPEKMEMRVYCNLTPEQAAHYERLVKDMLNEVDAATGIRRRGLILATLTKLKQTCNHPEHLLPRGGPLDGRSGKCERLVEMLEEVLEEGDAALVFTQYRKMSELLERFLTRRLRTEILLMHGGTPARKRRQLVDRFQDCDSPTRIFLMSLKTGGFGLNLTRANHVFHFDRWWNPAVEDQATDRAHRIGQTRRVQVHKFVCIGTIEDRIDEVLAEKSAVADRIMGSGDEWLTSLSTRELRDYLMLSPDAVAET
ncbi:MAG: DEAD/DEAH box helicase [Planctomycetota bacterium]